MANRPSAERASTPAGALDSPRYNGDAIQDAATASIECEGSPASMQLASGAETPVSDPIGSSAGRKRKSNSTSARGVANLTPVQLAKKRANDRQAQRAIRERTKAHIETLEQQVRELSSQKPYQDLQDALRQNEAILAENREMKQRLRTIVDTIQPLVAREMLDPNALHALTRPILPQPITTPFADMNQHPAHVQRAGTVDPVYSDSTPSAGATPSPINPPAGSCCSSMNSGDHAASIRHALESQRHVLAHGLDFSSDERLGFNFLLDGTHNIPKVDGIRRTSDTPRSDHMYTSAPLYASPVNPPFSDQGMTACTAPIRNIAPTCPLDAILLDFLHKRQQEAAQGVPRQNLVGPPYPSVSSLLNPEKNVYSHPVSKVFTDILRTFPDIYSLPEQVAVLYNMFILMRWQIYPTQENYDRLPDWLTPRPSQLLTPHPAWIDYLPWPRMRDRLVMSYQHYPFENWFIPFTRGLSVNWPYEASDCLLFTAESDELMINPVFERHFRNLNNWSLGPEFAQAFPALVDTTRIKPETRAPNHPPPPPPPAPPPPQ